MRIVSFNIRRLGGKIKKRTVKELVFKEKVEFICLQEIKLELLMSGWHVNCGETLITIGFTMGPMVHLEGYVLFGIARFLSDWRCGEKRFC